MPQRRGNPAGGTGTNTPPADRKAQENEMPLFKLNMPNDYGSEKDVDAMEADGGDYSVSIAAVANDAGLVFVEETDYGATWVGTLEQFAACVEALPEWAQPYASVEA